MIGVLTQQKHLYVIEIGGFQSVENIAHGRIDRPLGIFLLEKLPELSVVFALQIGLQDVIPAISEKDHGRYLHKDFLQYNTEYGGGKA